MCAQRGQGLQRLQPGDQVQPMLPMLVVMQCGNPDLKRGLRGIEDRQARRLLARYVDSQPLEGNSTAGGFSSCCTSTTSPQMRCRICRTWYRRACTPASPGTFSTQLPFF